MTSIGLAERTDLLGYPCSSLKQILSCTPPASLARRARFSLCELAGYSPPRSAAQRFSTTFEAKRRFEPGPPRQPTGTAFARRTAPGRTAATARPIASTGAAGASHDGVGLLTPTLLPRRERAYYTRPTVASGVDDKRASRRRRGVGRPRRAESVPKEHSGLVCPLRRAGERASGAWQQRELRWWRTGTTGRPDLRANQTQLRRCPDARTDTRSGRHMRTPTVRRGRGSSGGVWSLVA